MSNQLRTWVALGVGALMLCRIGHAADPGVTDTEIKLGNTGSYSGPASSAIPQVLTPIAYFKMLNEKGGINGRKINIVSLDDGFSPPKTVEMTRKLVEQDNVLFMFGQMGTAASSAVQPYLNGKGIPQLMIGSGASKFNNPSKFPWTIGTSASYRGEAVAFGKYIRQKMPNAKVGIYYQNDDLGKDYLEGVAEGLGDKAATAIVAKTPLDMSEPTFDSQLLTLKSAGVDVVVIATVTKGAVYALRKMVDWNWKPQVLLGLAGNSVSATMEPAGGPALAGVITTTAYKDASDTRWAKDPEYLEYVAFLEKYLPQLNKNDTTTVSGYIVAQVVAKILTDAGNDLSRENIKKVATSIKNFRPKMAAPDVSFTLSPTDYEMFKSLQLMRFNGKTYEPVSGS